MKRLVPKIIAVTALLALAQGASAAVIFKQTCDTLPTGVYTLEQLKVDFVTTSGTGFVRKGEGENRVTVVTSSPKPSGRSLKVKYPAGGYDSKPSGAQWKTDLKGKYQELYMSYYVFFDSTFELDKIGKLPGFGGGLNYEDREAATEWSAKLMWRNYVPEFYLHSPVDGVDKKFPWNYNGQIVRFQKGRWYHIELHYKMNTVGQSNGLMEAWLDGRLVGRYTDTEFRTNSGVGITLMFFSTFYGGNSVDAPTRTNYAYFDEFVVSTTRIGYTAP